MAVCATVWAFCAWKRGERAACVDNQVKLLHRFANAYIRTEVPERVEVSMQIQPLWGETATASHKSPPPPASRVGVEEAERADRVRRHVRQHPKTTFLSNAEARSCQGLGSLSRRMRPENPNRKYGCNKTDLEMGLLPSLQLLAELPP